MRSLKHITTAQKINMGGIFLDQAIPSGLVERVDPFVLIHHWNKPLPGGQHQRDVGVGPHPHRGFSPVTLVFKGGVHHRDSRGGESCTYEGGAQWMNSGSGIIHSERPVQSLARDGGDFEIIQLWINAPAVRKFDTPEYFSLQKDKIPLMSLDSDNISVAIVAGKFMNLSGPVYSAVPLTILRLDFTPSGSVELPIPKEFNLCVYQLDGQLRLNDTFESHAKQLSVFENDGSYISIKCIQPGQAVLMTGKPIHEPVVSYGPFVMNNYQEIQEAISDYQNGKIGTLVENFDD